MPIIADWYNVLQENAETKHLAVVLARYVTGSASAMGARNDIDLDNKYSDAQQSFAAPEPGDLPDFILGEI